MRARPLYSARRAPRKAIGCARVPCIALKATQRSCRIRSGTTPRAIYIAGSKAAILLKVGTCVDSEQRRRNLRSQMYGVISDWEMLFTAKEDAGGKVEGDALARLSKHKVVRMYEKDGKKQ